MPLSSAKAKRIISSDFDAVFVKNTARLLAGEYTHVLRIDRPTPVSGDGSVSFGIIPQPFSARVVEVNTTTRRRSDASERNERRVIILATVESQAPFGTYIGMKKGDRVAAGSVDDLGSFTANGQLYEIDSVRPNKDHAVYAEALMID